MEEEGSWWKKIDRLKRVRENERNKGNGYRGETKGYGGCWGLKILVMELFFWLWYCVVVM